ncbi:MAG: hypothetical protein ACOCQR_03745 [bacterium]
MDIKEIVEKIKGQTIVTCYGSSVVQEYDEVQNRVLLLEYGDKLYALNPYDFVKELNHNNGHNFTLNIKQKI